MSEALLSVSGLSIEFVNRDGVARVVDDVSFELRPAETLGVVGELGCGKSVTALSILRLLPMPPARHVGGVIHYRGVDLASIPERQMRRIRGNDISMIFQEPMVSLNPVMTIGKQLVEVVKEHRPDLRGTVTDYCRELLELVRIPEASRRLDQYPHELSGGMRQRVMIAMALACNPQVLIADEPTTALDVTIQAQILTLIADLQERLGTAVMFISHDLRVVAEIASRVIVMYAGRIVEEGPSDILFERPAHPYTVGLLGAIPRLDEPSCERLAEIPGMVPNPLALPAGCAFAERCPKRISHCHEFIPPMRSVGPSHRVACWVAGHDA